MNLFRSKKVILGCGLFLAVSVQAREALWQGSGSNFNTSSNWVGGSPGPTDYGAFSNSGSSSVNFSTDTTIEGLIFRPGAPTYTLGTTALASFVVISTGGIVNQSANQQRVVISSGNLTFIVAGPLTGNIQLVNNDPTAVVGLINSRFDGPIDVVNRSTGSIIITEFSTIAVTHAGIATMENEGGGLFVLGQGFRGDQSIMRNTLGTLQIDDNTDLTTMSIINEDTMTLTSVSASSVAFGNLSGSGNFVLGNKTMIVGVHDTSSEISGVISGSGGSLIKMGQGTLILSGTNVYSGSTTVNEGTLQGTTNSLRGRIADYASLVFDQGTDGTFSGILTGTGTLSARGAGRLNIADAQTFSGTVHAAGALNVDGSLLAASTVVDPNGLLSGTGQLGPVNNSGTLRPGSGGTGVLTVASYRGTGALEIPFGNPIPPKLTVQGDATLDGGTLRLTGSQFLPGRYTVLTGSTVSGTFASVSAPVFLGYNTDYTPNAVQVVIRSFNLSNAAATANEQALAGALDTVASPLASPASDVPGSADAGRKLFQLQSPDAVHQAMEQLSGDALASFYDVSLRQGKLFTEQITARAVPMDSASTAMLAAPIQLAMNGDAKGLGAPKPATKPGAVWARAIGGFATTKADGGTGSPESSANTGGFETGYDRQMGDAATLGVFLGYARTGVTVNDRDSSGHTNSLGLGVYGRFAPGSWFFDGAAGYVRNSNEMDRTIAFLGETAHSKFSSPVLTLSGDAGHAFELAADTVLEPFLALRISRASQEGFTETGAPDSDLTVDQKSLTSIVPAIAVRGTHLFKPESRHPFLLGANLGLEFELGDVDRSLGARFADGTGPSFTVQGTPQKRTALDLGLGGRLAVTENLQAFMNYGLTVASEHFAQAIQGGARLAW